MTRDDILSRILIDPNICFGKPCIKGHRIWVSLILDFLASGWSMAEILENYPGLEEEDIRACIRTRLPHVGQGGMSATPCGRIPPC
jgi:uncharacterized protein (DUF433 family)